MKSILRVIILLTVLLFIAHHSYAADEITTDDLLRFQRGGESELVKWRNNLVHKGQWTSQEIKFSIGYPRMDKLLALKSYVGERKKSISDANARLKKAMDILIKTRNEITKLEIKIKALEKSGKKVSPKDKEKLAVLKTLDKDTTALGDKASKEKAKREKEIKGKEGELKKLEDEYKAWMETNPDKTPLFPGDKNFNWILLGQKEFYRQALYLIKYYYSDATPADLSNLDLDTLGIDTFKIDPDGGEFYHANAEEGFKNTKGASIILHRQWESDKTVLNQYKRKETKLIVMKALVMCINKQGNQETQKQAKTIYNTALTKNRIPLSDMTKMYDILIDINPEKTYYQKK